MRRLVSPSSGEGYAINGGVGRRVACTAVTMVGLTCPGCVLILKTREPVYACLSERWRADTVRRRPMQMVVMLGLVPLLVLAMAVGGPEQGWGRPRARLAKLAVPPAPSVPPVPSLPPSPPVPLMPPVPEIHPLQPFPRIPPRP
jgi:hypothetical protein